MKNPDWIREELILALDLYFKLDYGQMHGKHPSVIELSETLKSLNLIKNVENLSNFRSIGSVALKLANFKKLDRNFGGSGMKAGAKLDKEIWKEFSTYRDTLNKEAELIKRLYLKKKDIKLKINTSDLFYQYHKNRESDPIILKFKKEMTLLNDQKLSCEICDFDFSEFYGQLGNDLMEIHFKKELEEEPGIELNELNDFIIVCSNCHKVLDKNYGIITYLDLKQIINI